MLGPDKSINKEHQKGPLEKSADESMPTYALLFLSNNNEKCQLLQQKKESGEI